MKAILLVLALILVTYFGHVKAERAKYWGCVNGALEACTYKNMQCSMNDMKPIFEYCRQEQP